MASTGKLSPFSVSILYCLMASVSVGLISYFEGTLLTDVKLVIGDQKITQYAYINNRSTIANFILLNPLAIYFLLKAKKGYKKAYSYFNDERVLPLYHQFGTVVLSAIVGTSAMCFYFNGFIGGDFFSAAFEPNAQGKAEVSVTGALIFFWTSLYMSFLCFSFIGYGQYILFIRDKKVSDFGMSLSNKLHKSISIAITPCVYIMYALTTIFVVLVIFIIRDHVRFNIEESRRIWLLAPYLFAGACSAIPFFHLHKLMKSQKTEMIDRSSIEVERRFLRSAVSPNWKSIDLDNVLSAAELVEKSNKLCDSLKVWPVQLQTLTMPNISFALSLLTLTYKVSSLFFTSQTA